MGARRGGIVDGVLAGVRSPERGTAPGSGRTPVGSGSTSNLLSLGSTSLLQDGAVVARDALVGGKVGRFERGADVLLWGEEERHGRQDVADRHGLDVGGFRLPR